MKNCSSKNIRKHREIKNSDKYIALCISLKFGNLDKIKIASSEPKEYLGGSGKVLIASLGLKTIRKSKNIKKTRFDINEFSIKDISNIIKEFKDVSYGGYARKSSKQMPTECYLYLPKHIEKCMMRNSRGPVRMQNMST